MNTSLGFVVVPATGTYATVYLTPLGGQPLDLGTTPVRIASPPRAYDVSGSDCSLREATPTPFFCLSEC